MRSAPPHFIALLFTLTLLGVAVLSVLPAPAGAGDYTVQYCQQGMALQDWQRQLTTQGTITEGCASGTSGPRVVMDPNSNAQGSGVAWVLTWPSGIQPVYLNVRANRLLNAGTGATEGGVIPYGSCITSAAGNPCPSGQTTSVVVNQAVSPSAGAAGQRFAIGVRCPGPSIAPCGGGSGTVDVSVLQVTWRDTTAPTGTATIDGGTRPDSTPIKGAHQVQYRAADGDGSGVQQIQARIDQQPVASSPAQCSAPYTSMRACPTGAIGELTLDTSRVNDGAHRLDVVAIDVGGNEGTLLSVPIVTQNGDTIGPGSDPILRGLPNGTYPADDARVMAWWPTTAKAPSKNRKTQRRCKASPRYRRNHKRACTGKAPSQRLKARYNSRHNNLVRGRLLTPHGNGIAGATLQIIATPQATPAVPLLADTVTTDGTGRFAVRLPVATGSQVFRVQWKARTRDTQPVATTELRRTVTAATSLRIRPGKLIYRGQRLQLTGHLKGTSGTPGGTAVLIQAQAGKGHRWRAVTTVRARQNGNWTAAYRIPRQLRGHYRFRALIKPSAAYPYASGATAPRPITVRRGR